MRAKVRQFITFPMKYIKEIPTVIINCSLEQNFSFMIKEIGKQL